MIKANRVSWVKRLISSKGKWKVILEDLIKPLSLYDFLQTNLSKDEISCIPIPFYRQILTSWNEIKEQPSSGQQYMQEVIWDNKYILTPSSNKKSSKKNTIFCPKLYKAGVIRVGDLIDDNGHIIDYSVFRNKYCVDFNILSYYKVAKAIPKHWLVEIEKYVKAHQISAVDVNHCLNISCNEATTHICKASAKTICNYFIKRKCEIPAAIEKWEEIYQTDLEWKTIFRLPYTCTRETQLQALQYRIIHRYVPCKKWLCNINVVASGICESCNVQDDIQHFLFACTPVRIFWSQLESWWNNVSNCPVVLTEKHVIFGLYYDLKYFTSINYVLLLGKMYIYRQKMQEKELSFKYFLHELKNRLMIEKSICESNNGLLEFNRKWESIIEILNNNPNT